MALGLASGYIGDGALTVSSSKPGYEAWRARLHGTSYWRPDKDDTNQYFTVYLYNKINLTAIASQGAVNETCWITAYTLDALQNTWIKYKENNVVKVSIVEGDSGDGSPGVWGGGKVAGSGIPQVPGEMEKKIRNNS